jgi:hypothetical protein
MAFVCLTVAYNPLAIRSRSQRVLERVERVDHAPIIFVSESSLA